MDAAFQKIKEQGPPQWFIDAFREAEEKRQADQTYQNQCPEYFAHTMLATHFFPPKPRIQ
eukprot:6263151-Amphidinium_carterae.1